jgi:uncharacterized protein YxeA
MKSCKTLIIIVIIKIIIIIEPLVTNMTASENGGTNSHVKRQRKGYKAACEALAMVF